MHFFRNHLHAEKVNVLQNSDYECNICNIVCSAINEILKHTLKHIVSGSKVNCPYHDCANVNKVYATISSLKSLL